MRKRLGVWVLVTLFSIVIPGSLALAGSKGQGGEQSGPQGKRDNGQPPGWSQGKKTGWNKKDSTVPPGLQKKEELPKGLQKSR